MEGPNGFRVGLSKSTVRARFKASLGFCLPLAVILSLLILTTSVGEHCMALNPTFVAHPNLQMSILAVVANIQVLNKECRLFVRP